MKTKTKCIKIVTKKCEKKNRKPEQNNVIIFQLAKTIDHLIERINSFLIEKSIKQKKKYWKLEEKMRERVRQEAKEVNECYRYLTFKSTGFKRVDQTI